MLCTGAVPRRWFVFGVLTFAAAALVLFQVGFSQPPQGTGDPAKGVKPSLSTGDPMPADWLKPLSWRCIGPANMGGRITAISVYEADPSIYYVATASGGLLKTINNGITFQHQFDKEATVSIGDVCVAPSNPLIVWVGTGENNPRNSVSYGDGVYKSTDGGKSWKNMGLKETFQIGKIVIHPKNPDIVYVGALGRLYGPHRERGLFKTTDGGKTWDKVLYLDDNTGIIDIAMHPQNPDTLLAAAWERKRDGHDSYLGPGRPEGVNVYDPIVKWGAKAGIYKTVDGGKKFERMTKGLPTNNMGRIGLDYYRKNPDVVYAIVDCEKIGMGPPPKKVAGNAFLGAAGDDADNGARLTRLVEGGPADRSGLKVDDIVQVVGGKKIDSYETLVEQVQQLKPKDKVKFLIVRASKAQEIEVTLGQTQAPKGGFGPGGGTKTRPYYAFYGGQAANRQEEQGPDSHEYGGVYRSNDGGASWARVNSINPRPMYFSQVRVDPSDDQYVYVLGIAMHMSSDGGKYFRSRGGVHADGHALWINPKDGRHMIVGTDGGHYVTHDRMKNWDHYNHMALGQFYHVAVCTKRPYWVYGGLQDNGTWGGPSIGLKGGIGPINEDWVSIFGGDGYVCRIDPNDPDLIYFEMQDGGMGRRHLRTGEFARIAPERRKGEEPHRFNWNTPYILSQHNSKIFYCAGEYVFRSVKRGDELRIISPEITLTNRGSATALAESPKNPDVLWVGSDDGAIWVTRDGGKEWSNVTSRLGLKRLLWVSTIEASRKVEGRAYVAFDAHRSDDDQPYLYMTEDYGDTWTNITANLPAVGSTRCLREDVDNPDVLYCGTEFGVFVSFNRGESWAKLNNNLPTVAVHEIAVHPTAGEIVAATHGRSLWILDVSALRQMSADSVKEPARLYKPQTAVRWQMQPSHGRTNRRFVGENPIPGAHLYYSLNGEKPGKVSVRVLDIDGAVLKELPGSARPGLHKLTWDMTQPAPASAKTEKKKGPGGPPPRRVVPPGHYRVVLSVDGKEFTQTLRVEADPNAPPRAQAVEEEMAGRPPIDERNQE